VGQAVPPAGSPYGRTATTATQALAPVESNARRKIVDVPRVTGIPVATQEATPDATPVAPSDVCQATLVMPVPPEAVPLTDIVEPVAVTIGEAGEATATAMSCPNALATITIASKTGFTKLLSMISYRHRHVGF